MAVTFKQTPAAGDEHLDTLAAAQRDVDVMISRVEPDEFSPPLVAAAKKANTALAAVHDGLWEAADGIASQLAGQGEMLREQAEANARALPTSGWGSPSELEAARTETRNGVFRLAKQTAATVVLKAKGGPLQDRADAAALAMQDVADKWNWAAAQSTGPRSLRDDTLTIEDLHRVGAVVRDLKARKNPMRYALDYLEIAAKSADAKTLGLFTDAALEVADELKQTPTAKLAARYETSRDLLDNERALAFQLERAIQRLRDAQRPKSLDAMKAIVGGLSAVFAQLLGTNAYDMGNSAFAQRYLDGGRTGKSQNLFEIDRGWPQRWLPPRADGPPGWSAPFARSGINGIARMGITNRRF